MMSESVPLLQLMQTKGLGPRSLTRVLDLLDQEQLTLADFVALDPDEMVSRYRLKSEQALSIQENEETAVKIAEQLEHHGVHVVLRGTSLYPPRLSSLLGDKAPPALFIANSPDLLQQRGVGFCGARDASEEAMRCAQQVAYALAKHELLVVSGHAPGVDET